MTTPQFDKIISLLSFHFEFDRYDPILRRTIMNEILELEDEDEDEILFPVYLELARTESNEPNADDVEATIAYDINNYMTIRQFTMENAEDDIDLSDIVEEYRIKLENTLEQNYGYDIVIKQDGKFITIPASLNLLDTIDEMFDINQLEGNYDNLMKVDDDGSITPFLLNKSNIVKTVLDSNEGAYFPYNHKADIDLSEFQIFDKNMNESDLKREHCFINTLELLRDNFYQNFNHNQIKVNKTFKYRSNDYLKEIEESSKLKMEVKGYNDSYIEEYKNLLNIMINDFKSVIGRGAFKTRFISEKLPKHVKIRVNKYTYGIDKPKSTEYVNMIHKDNPIKHTLFIDLLWGHYVPNFRVNYSITTDKRSTTFLSKLLYYFNKNDLLEPAKYNFIFDKPSIDIEKFELDLNMVTVPDQSYEFDNVVIENMKAQPGYKPLTPEEKELKNKEIDMMLEELDSKRKNHKIEKRIYFYCDFETITYYTHHLPLLLGAVSEENENVLIYRSRTTTDLQCNNIFHNFLIDLKSVCKKLEDENTVIVPVLYFHNLKYDYSIIKSCRKFYIRSEITKGSQLYGVRGSFEKMNIILKDSYKIFSHPLSKFKSALKTKHGKTDFGLYSLVDTTNYNKDKITIKELETKCTRDNLTLETLSKDVKDYIKDGYFHHISAYVDYLKDDCLTLREGMLKFKDCVYDLYKLDMHNYYSISSIANSYMRSQGCYTDVATFKGSAQEYIMKSVQGGRVQLANNKKIIIDSKDSGPIQDFDAVSLYPSAMSTVVIPTDIPEQLYNLPTSIKELDKKFCQYIATVKYRVIKDTKISMYSVLENNKRNWGGKQGEIITQVLPKRALEDLVNFQGVKILEIPTGLFWDREDWPPNETMNTTIKEIFNMRLVFKNQKNIPMSETTKLVMNSAYGRTLLTSDHKNKKIIYGDKRLEKYKTKNYSIILSIVNMDNKKNGHDRYEVTTIDYNLHDNYCQVGAFILAESKHIMNKVLHIANENNIEIYYTDTDSIHISDNGYKLLAKQYKKKYNEELVGKTLGKFHTDFESSKLAGMYFDYCKHHGVKKINDEGEEIYVIKEKFEVISEKFIGLGKKCYLDILALKEKPNKVEDCKCKYCSSDDHIDYHIRFKGAHASNIIEYCKKLNITVEDFYMKLYEGEEVTLDLCKGKVRFEYDKKSVKTRDEFIRRYKF